MERREALITGLVLLGLCLGVAALFSVARSGPSDVALLGSNSEDPPPRAIDATSEFDAFVSEAIAFVEATRGRRFVHDPVVTVLSEAQFVARIRADLSAGFEEEPDDVDMFNAIYRSTGLIGVNDSIDDVYRQFGEAGILGFYDPLTDELVVRQRDELSLLTKSTIVHELTHAFDDQHFELDRPHYEDRADEVAWGFRAVAEGSASWVEAEWESTLTASDQNALLREEQDFGDPGIFDQFQFSFLLLELSPYQYGEPFVDHLVAGGGTDALDEALEDPPITSEQVIDPTRYDVGEGPIDLAPPPADGDIEFSGIGGQVLIDSMFMGNGVNRGFEWGGDLLVVWTADSLSCLRWDIQAENGSTSHVIDDFEAWGARVGRTNVFATDDRTVRVERCV